MGWLEKLFNLDSKRQAADKAYGQSPNGNLDARSDACNRLKLVLMHDRTQLSPAMMAQLRDELVEVISKYVEIDRSALDLNLESESNTIALVANIPIIRARAMAS
jgi:cell division topological specificity factor